MIAHERFFGHSRKFGRKFLFDHDTNVEIENVKNHKQQKTIREKNNFFISKMWRKNRNLRLILYHKTFALCDIWYTRVVKLPSIFRKIVRQKSRIQIFFFVNHRLKSEKLLLKFLVNNTPENWQPIVGVAKN